MKSFLMSASICLLAFSGCRDRGVEVLPQKEQPLVREFTALEKAVVSSDNAFGLKLFANITQASPGKNIFISPLSVSMALGMVLNGADGGTLDSMKQALEHSNYSMQEINESYKNISSILTNLDPKVVFQIANSIWYRNTFEVFPTFINDCHTYFDAEAAALDFNSPEAVTRINSWVNNKTNGKIPIIIDQIPPEMMMCLINAIYFKGSWTYRFDASKTIDAPFTVSEGNTVTCKMMTQKATYAYRATSEEQMIDLPYGDRMFSMTIILPKEGIDIDQYVIGLTQQRWNSMTSNLDSADVDLYLPKFKLEYTKLLNDELKAMGMEIAFSDFANFSKMAPTRLCISIVKHKTFVEVNEEGTEATAVTVVGMATTSIPANPVMRINRPFIFAIREQNSGTVLFIGKIVNPVAS